MKIHGLNTLYLSTNYLSDHLSRRLGKVAKAKMFSFHKPKVYRSSTGCCICKAKSSSSRFTDSKKYEDDFIKCFQLEERRTGEICNACVLLVKRWKKLPVGSSRNWRHVVDARAGPGIKSLTKFKAKNKKKLKDVAEKFDKILKKKHVYLKNDREREQSPAMSDDLTEEYLTGNRSKSSSRAGSPAGSDDTGVEDKRLDIDQGELLTNNFIDLTYFKRKTVCCGVIFVGMMGEVLIEPAYLKPCSGCLARQRRERAAVEAATSASATMALVSGSSPSHSSASASPCHSSASTSPAHSVESGTEGSVKAKAFCDSSSDSGYDDSNQGLIIENRKQQQQQQQHQSPTSQSLHLVGTKSAAAAAAAAAAATTTATTKPSNKTQILKSEKIVPVSRTVRLKSLGGAVGPKMPIKLLCKPVALVGSAKLSLGGSGPNGPVEAVIAVPAAVDFAVRCPPSRQSIAN